MPGSSALRRRMLVALAAVPLLTAGLSAFPAAASTADLRSAESLVLHDINQQRSAHGLAPIRLDTRIRAVAEARSADMVKRHYFGHQDPDGKWPWDHLNDAGIAWWGAGEIIAMNTVAPIEAAADHAVAQWMASTAGHREQILSTTSNYAGVGVALDGGASYWTVVFIEGPDHTGAVASLTRATRAPSHHMRVTWQGSDPRLVTHTAGLATFDVARRIVGGSWTTIRWGTPSTALTLRGRAGTRYQFRVRARDRDGNVGAWSPARSVIVR